MKAQGLDIGVAPVDEDMIPLAKDFLTRAQETTEIILPRDFRVIDREYWERIGRQRRNTSPSAYETVAATDLLSSHLPMDIGPKTLLNIEALLSKARTLVWNGPLGAWEREPFGDGTREVARLVIARASEGLRGILFGGSLTSALGTFDLPKEQIRKMSSPSQATRQLLAGGPLPAVEALRNTSDLAVVPARPRRVLLLVDESEDSQKVVENTGALLQKTGAQIHLLFVKTLSHFAAASGWIAPNHRHPIAIRERLQAERVFDLSSMLLAQYGLVAHQESIMEGDPAECVLRYADEMAADLVAVRCRALPGPLRFQTGELAPKIEHRMNRPILLVRTPA